MPIYTPIHRWLSALCLFWLAGGALQTQAQALCDFTFSPAGNLCATTPIRFRATTNLPLDSIAFTWDFGDGSPVALGNPVTHAYGYNTVSTTYTVRLTILDITKSPANDTCVISKAITIQYSPQITLSGQTEFCQINLNCTDSFTTTLSIAPGVALAPYTWNFGDGGPPLVGPQLSRSRTYGFGTHYLTVTGAGSSCPGLRVPVRYYTQPKNPVLNAPSTFKCEGDTIVVSNASNDCPGNIDYYLIYWDNFAGPNNPGGPVDTFNIGGSAKHVYRYDRSILCGPTALPGDDLYFFQPTIGLVSQSYYYQCSPMPAPPQWIAGPVNIIPTPKPDFFFPPICYCYPNTPIVSFTSSVCPAPRSNYPVNYRWNFGDPASGALNTITGSTTNNSNNLPPVSHAFSGPGSYQVALTVDNPLDSCGANTIIKTVNICSVPVPDIAVSGLSGCAPLAVTYTNNTTAFCGFTTTWTVTPNIGVSISGGPNAVSPVITFNNPGTYVVRARIANCCSTLFHIDTVRVQGPPSVQCAAIANGCGDLLITPTGTVVNNGSAVGAYLWNFGTNAFPVSSASLNPGPVRFTPTSTNPPTSFTITLSASNACGSSTATQSFLLVASPGVSAGGNDTVCLGTQICLPCTPPGGRLRILPSGLLDTSRCFTFRVPGTYRIEYQYEVRAGLQLCNFRDTAAIHVPPPEPIIAGPPATLCTGDTLQLRGLPGGGTWTGSPHIIISGGDTLFVPTAPGVGQPSQAVKLYYNYTNPLTRCSNRDSLTVTVHGLPVVNIVQGSISLCESNAPQNLNSLFTVSPAGGSWSLPGGVFTPNQPGTYTVYYSFTNANGCSNLDSASIQVLQVTPPNAGADASVCLNTPAYVLPGFSPAGGVWSGPGIQNAATGLFNPAAAGVNTHALVYSSGTGTCLRRDTVRVRVQPLPAVAAGPPAALCTGDTLRLRGLPGGGSWSGSPRIFIAGGDTLFVPNTPAAGGPSQTVNLTYTYTAPATGCANTALRSLTVHSLPVVNIVQSSISLCESNAPQNLNSLFNATPAGGVWSEPGGVFTPTTAGTYKVYYTYVNSNGCRNLDSANIVVTVPPLPNAGADASVCLNTPAYVLPGFSPAGGVWSGTGIQNAATGLFNPAAAGVNTHVLVYSTGTGTCLRRDTLRVRVQPLPAVAAGPPAALCTGDTLRLRGLPGGGSWSGSPRIFIAGGDTLFVPNTPAAGGISQTVNLTYTYTAPATGCANTAVRSLTVHSLPVVNIVQSSISLCESNAPQNLNSLFNATPAGGVWSEPGGVFTPTTAGTYKVYYTFVNSNGCRNLDSANIVVTVPPLPNAGSDASVCLNTPAYVLPGFSPAGGVWSGTGIQNAATGLFNPAAAGASTHVLLYSTGTGTCLRRDTLRVRVQPLPAVAAGPPAALCTGDTLRLRGLPGGGSWSGSPRIFIAGGDTLFVPNAPVPGGMSQPVNLTYTYTAPATGCANTAVRSLTVHSLPVVSISPATLTFCLVNQQLSLPAASPAGGVWSGMGVVNSSAGLFNPSVAGLGTVSLTYSFRNANNCENSATMQVQVIALDSISAGPDTALCRNAGRYTPINLFPAYPAGGAVLSGPGILANGQFNPALAGLGLHALLYSKGTGSCRVTDTLRIRVKPLPLLQAGISDTVCVNAPVFVLRGAGPAPGVWFGLGVSADSVFNPATHGSGSSLLGYHHTSALGCRDTLFRPVRVDPLPSALFNLPPNNRSCKNVATAFSNLSSGAARYRWDFGDGSSSTLASPSHTYSATGTYTVRLIAYGPRPAECTDTLVQQLSISELPQADFAPLPASGCGPQLQVQFSDSSLVAGASYAWSFGNGQSSASATPPPVVYGQGRNDTTYYISLTLTNFCGSSIRRDSVRVLPSPTARFLPSVNDGCSPLPVSFRNLSFGLPQQYFWNLGNGRTSTLLQPPSQVYTTGSRDSIYIIQLIATNVCGTDTFYDSVLVRPQQLFAFFNPSVSSGCEPLIVSFNDGSGAPFISWDFGDGATGNGARVQHTYQRAGTYTITQYVNDGCSYDTIQQQVTVFPAPQTAFSHAPAVCAGQPISFTNSSSGATAFLWRFGDGDSSGAVNPVHSYSRPGSYTVSLTAVANTFGCTRTTTSTLLVRPNPRIVAQPSVSAGCEALNVQFSSASQGAFHYWDFGNGLGTSSLRNPVYRFAQAGVYTVTLRNEDANGCVSDTAMQITVHPVPKSDFRILNDGTCGIPATVAFLNLTPDTLTASAWSFGDGSVSGDRSPSHVFSAPGQFTVRLISTNTFGCRDTALRTARTYHQPVAGATLSPDRGCNPLTVAFTNTSQNYTRAVWNLGNNQSYTGATPPAVTYFVPDTTYRVVLRVDYQGQCFDSLVIPVRVERPPVADFNFVVSGDSCSGPITVQTQNLSQHGTRYFWDFGDGQQFSFATDPRATYSQPGRYTITLVVSNEVGCADTLRRRIGLYEYPVALFEALTPQRGCAELAVQFQGLTPGGTDWQWLFGDGSSGTGASPRHVYTQPGFYDVTLIVATAAGCRDTLTLSRFIEVLPTPEANFSWAPLRNTPPRDGVIQFTNLSVGATRQVWDFGEGGTSQEENPVYRYYRNGPHTVTLYVFNDYGCPDTAVLAEVNPPAFGGLYIPNAFAPLSGVQGADVFKPVGVGLVEFEIAVYSTWGDLVWYSNKLTDGQPAEAWDGRDLNGNLHKLDAFVWRVTKARFTDGRDWEGMAYSARENPSRVGTVTLIR